MKNFFSTIMVMAIIFICLGTGNAWQFNTHKDSVVDAFEYMESKTDGTGEYFAANFLKYAGGDDVAEKLGIKNSETDDFYDTSIGGWWIGYRTHGEIGGFVANFTSFWHFFSMFRPGTNGNAYDGYSYQYSMGDGFWGNNGLMYSALYNQDVQNKGNAGKEIFNDTGGKGVKSAYKFKYQNSASEQYYSTTPDNNYDDYQDVIFEPSSNAGAYWYGRSIEGKSSTTITWDTLQYLGSTLHMAGDANVTQHVWDTSDNYHTGYEGWVNDNYTSLFDVTVVEDYIEEFKTEYSITDDSQLKNITLQEIFVFFANKALNNTAPLYSEDSEVRRAAGIIGYNGAVAINVLILEKYVYDLYVEEDLRKF
ncbi:MAG: hypothetical protein GY754_20345 [bacterium]|nr:hypothetical protein [bacterium]